jgi:hypothetical protein
MYLLLMPSIYGGTERAMCLGCSAGGLTKFLPLPPEAMHTVGVTPFPSRQLRLLFPGTVITPDTYDPDFDVPLGELLKWAFSPAAEGDLLSLIQKGRVDAQQWASRSCALEAAQVSSK